MIAMKPMVDARSNTTRQQMPEVRSDDSNRLQLQTATPRQHSTPRNNSTPRTSHIDLNPERPSHAHRSPAANRNEPNTHQEACLALFNDQNSPGFQSCFRGISSSKPRLRIGGPTIHEGQSVPLGHDSALASVLQLCSFLM